jgi:hypothetical protein
VDDVTRAYMDGRVERPERERTPPGVAQGEEVSLRGLPGVELGLYDVVDVFGR